MRIHRPIPVITRANNKAAKPSAMANAKQPNTATVEPGSTRAVCPSP